MRPKRLSGRQIQIVELIGRDRLSYKAVARELGISRHTVKAHAVQIRDRLGSELSPRDALTQYYVTMEHPVGKST